MYVCVYIFIYIHTWPGVGFNLLHECPSLTWGDLGGADPGSSPAQISRTISRHIEMYLERFPFLSLSLYIYIYTHVFRSLSLSIYIHTYTYTYTPTHINVCYRALRIHGTRQEDLRLLREAMLLLFEPAWGAVNNSENMPRRVRGHILKPCSKAVFPAVYS